MFSKLFWYDALERAVKSAAQGALTALGGAKIGGLFTADWRNVGGAALMMAILSLLTSLGSRWQRDSISPASVAPSA